MITVTRKDTLTSLFLFGIVSIAVVMYLTQYMDAHREATEKVYQNLGIATIRLMDPEKRSGVEIPGAYFLSEDSKTL